jgi:spore coat protein U-like protein
MKKLLLTALMSLAALASVTAHAQSTATGNFDVVITLTSSCSLNTPVNGALGYTSFGTAASATATAATINVRCTNGVPYTATLNGSTSTTSNAYDFTDTTLNLGYRLTLAATGLSGTGTNAGTGVNQAYTITPSMTTAQGGTCNGPTCSSTANHTLTITY